MKSQPITKHAKALACASALCLAAASAYANNDEATAVAPVASGSIVQLVLGISNRLDFPSQEMARLRIEQVGADTKWSLAVNWNDQYNISTPFVQALDFQMVSGGLRQSSVSLFDVRGQVGVKSLSDNGIKFITSNNANRFTDGEAASWLLAKTNISQFVVQDLHINSLLNGQSVKFAPVRAVPEPASYAMLLLGFGALGLACVRRREDDGRVL